MSLLSLAKPRVGYAVGAVVAAAGALVALAARSGDPAKASRPETPAAAVAIAPPAAIAAPIIGRPTVLRHKADATLPEEYAILLQRSVFNRRGARPADQDAGQETAREHRPEATLILRGVSDENGTFKAFVEDMRQSRIWRLTTGETIGRGRVAQISFAGLRYETTSGRTTDVSIGCTFDGVALSGPASTQPSTITAAAAAAPLPLGLDGNGNGERRQYRKRGMEAAPGAVAAERQSSRDPTGKAGEKDR